MGTRERYEHGTCSYVELSTPDADGAKGFYAELFGWTYEDVPIGDDAVYTLVAKDGLRVAGLMAGQQRPAWSTYVTVDDVDAVTARVAGLGGTVLQAPFDVMDQGRSAVVQDPTGAVVCLWQAGSNIGASLVNAPGALSWNDLQTTDPSLAAGFYADLLGWGIDEVQAAPDERKGIMVGERQNGGIARLPAAAADTGVPSHWMAFFAVEGTDATVATAERAGGSVIAGPLDLPSGRMPILADPQGATFGVFAGELGD